jgi:serine/threonine-protein kinase
VLALIAIVLLQIDWRPFAGSSSELPTTTASNLSVPPASLGDETGEPEPNPETAGGAGTTSRTPADDSELLNQELPATQTVEDLTVIDTSIVGLESKSVALETTGALQVSVVPWARIVVDDSVVGTTPLPANIVLTAGAHRLRLENPEFPVVEEEIQIAAGEVVSLDLTLWDRVGRVMLDVAPWAEVSVDQAVRDTTPLLAPLVLAPGEHALRLRHPQLGIWETTIWVEAGTRDTISFDLRRLLARD